MSQPSSSHKPAQASPTATATEDLSSASDDSGVSTDEIADWADEASNFKLRRIQCKRTQQDLVIALGCGNLQQLRRNELGLERPPDSVIERWDLTLTRWEGERAAGTRKRRAEHPGANEVRDWFVVAFEAHTSAQPLWNGKHGKLAAGLLQQPSITFDEIKRRGGIMFERARAARDDRGTFPVQTAEDCTFEILAAHFNRFTGMTGKTRGYSDVPTQADFEADQHRKF